MSKRTWSGRMRAVVALFCAVGLMALISACNSGGDGGGGGMPPAASPSTGVFVDSPVQGLGYSCAPSGLSGVTNANGQYSFLPGDTVTFTLYGQPVGAAVPAGSVVTALMVFNATSLSDPRVINLSQLLLGLAGGPPAAGNPIVVPPTAPAGFPATLDFSAPGFDTSFPPSVTLVSEATAIAHLSTSFKTLAVTLVNSGAVTSNPVGITCTTGTCTAVFQTGTVVTLTAMGTGFTGWSGGTGNAIACNGMTTTCAFTLTGNTTTTANFNRPILTVTVVGTGTVTSNPVGITNCTSNCTAPFDRGTSVTLTAGAGLTGWSGVGCSGTGTCVLNNLQANTTVAATFGAVSSAAHYRFVWAEGGALMAIDPAAPTATPTTVVASGLQRMWKVADATYNSGPQTFTNIQFPIVTFAQGGRLWRVNTAKSAGIPGSAANPVVQVSNETGATNLCNYEVVQTGSPSTTRIVYEMGGADANCSTRTDNVSKLAPLLADVSTPPLILPAGTTGDGSVVFNFTTGQPVATFVTDHLNANMLKRLDLATNAVTTIQANVETIRFVAQDTSDRVFLRNDNTLFLYTSSTNTLTSLLTTATQLRGADDASGDGANLFVWEETGRVYRVPMTATAPTDVVTLISAPTTALSNLAITNTRLIPVTTAFSASGTQYGLVSIPKTGVGQVTLVHLQNNFIGISATVGNLLYYDIIALFPAQPDQNAVIVQDDNTPVATFTQSQWGGQPQGDTYSPRIDSNGVSHMIRTALGPSSADPYAGATVTAHNATSPLAAPVALGAVPTFSPPARFLGFDGLGGTTLIGTNSFTGFPGSHPVLFADRAQAGSLALVPLPTAEWQPESF